MNVAPIVRCLLEWFGRNARDLPWRRTRDPYAIWVSEVMLQQTQVKTVVPYWERWMKALPDIAALARATPAKIHKLWEGLGYYTRVRNLQKAAQAIVREHGGRFPDRFEEVLALPGIGRYTAGAICSIAFNQPTPILDGNVMRVLTRVFAVDGDPRERQTNGRLWELSEVLVRTAARQSCGHPKPSGSSRVTPRAPRPTSCSDLNQALMELGARICTPRHPTCGVCPVVKHCQAAGQGRVDELPALGSRPPVTERRFIAFVIRKGCRYLVRQRPAGAVNAYLWEFPNAEVRLEDDAPARAALRLFGGMPSAVAPFCSIRHTITRYRITLNVFTAQLPPGRRKSEGKWLTPAQMRRLPFTSAHKQILQRLG